MKRLLLLALGLALAGPASAQITVDGTVTDAGYRTLGTDTGGPGEAGTGTRGFGDANQINALYGGVNTDTGIINLGIAGALDVGANDGRNYILLFLDTQDGGYSTANYAGNDSFSGNGFSRLNQGITFDAGFLPDVVVQIGCFSDAAAPAANCAAVISQLAGTRGNGTSPVIFGGTDQDAAANGNVFRTAIDRTNPNNRIQGFELQFNAGTGLQGRRSVQAFAMLVSGSSDNGVSFLSNQFVSPAGAAQNNFERGAANFRNEPPDPVALVQQSLSGTAGTTAGTDIGYRLLSTPVTGVTVADLAAINFVQGIPAGDGNAQPQYPTNSTPNLYTSYAGSTTATTGNYNAAPSTGFNVQTGRGFFWRFYDDAFTIANPATFGGGTSQSYFIPERRLTTSGKVATPATGATVVTRAFPSNGSRFHMIGNPFAHAMLASAITADVEISNFVQAFQPSPGGGGSYTPLDRTSPAAALAVWQGVFAEALTSTGAVTFSYDATAAVPAQPTFYGREAASESIAFTLRGTTGAGSAVEDLAATVRVHPEARDGWDANDASKLTPPVAPYALISPVAMRDGAPYRAAVHSLAPSAEARTVPLAFLATDPGTYTLAWDATDLTGELRDLVTGAVVGLASVTEYTFVSDASDWTDRFELVLSQRGATSNEAAPTEALRVLSVRPNPTRTASEVVVELGEAQIVRASVVDALGRRVQTLHDGQAAAGSLALRVDASRLAPGVYVVRIEGASATATQTITVVR